MVKLVSRVAACGAASSPDSFVFFRVFLLAVKFRLHWAFDVFAELPSLVFGEMV